MGKRYENISKLLTALEEMKESATIHKLAEETGMHQNTLEELLNLFELLPELPFKVRIISNNKRKIIIKDDNLDSNQKINLKLNKIEKKLNLLMKR